MSIRIGITCGDINGIGPEIVRKALAFGAWDSDVQWTVIGPEKLFPNCAVWDVATERPPRPGEVCASAARTAVAAIERAVQGCLAGELDAMVTAPICKESLQRADLPWPGHTEMLAAMTGCKRYGMMLMGKSLRVMLATRHVPLRAVADALNCETIVEAIELTHEALAQLGASSGRIGVCGLNPHAGDGGALGDEDERVVRPAIEAARRRGLEAVGPVPADVIFYRALRGDFDAVVAMYHDQGLGPLKMHAFDCGVNWTVGLPIIRTSPDHGTAFDIAGQNCANPASMIAALQTAIELVKK